ncbi:hypothetical protein BJY04DRAFT_219768 [Aspergillus karnatakaensis]|uniref:uncharacterized protein n=1 Tax=Aspergillus karnatakaensis TaxID=1810916 RepID=UPI003CCDA17C
MGSQAGFRAILPEAVSPLRHRHERRPQVSKAAIADPRINQLFQTWNDTLKKPFYGITTDGKKKENLYKLGDESAPTEAATIAANKLIDALSPDEVQRVLHDLASEDWRKWSNTEILLYDVGLRLEDLEKNKIDLIWTLLEKSLSETGYNKLQAAVKINKFLGILASNPIILNEHSYMFNLFGQSSVTKPWGFSLSGHHLCLHVSFVGEQMTIGPEIDDGPHQGVELFRSELALPLQLMQGLPKEQQARAQKTDRIHEPDAPEWNIVDQRHRGGSGRDNEMVPYEGVVATDLSAEHQEQLLSIVATFHNLLPAGPLEKYLQLVRDHLPETYFTWTGNFGDGDPFYVRIQSPVALVELDCHSGIYLTNTTPAKHHIHTITRLPNGGDYRRELICLWKKEHDRKPSAGAKGFVRQLDKEEEVDTGFPKYRAQILSSNESAIVLASHIGEGGCGPGLHYHHSDQMYYLVRGTMTVRLDEEEYFVPTGGFVFIPAGLPHCNWNNGPGSETHLEMIVPALHRLKQLA